MPDGHSLTARQADQLRTDVANLESGFEVIMEQVARLPRRKKLWRAVLLGMLGGRRSRPLRPYSSATADAQ